MNRRIDITEAHNKLRGKLAEVFGDENIFNVVRGFGAGHDPKTQIMTLRVNFRRAEHKLIADRKLPGSIGNWQVKTYADRTPAVFV